MKNKKAQGMSTSTVILLVLGVIVLVVLALGFTMGWQKFGTFLSSSNVNNIVTECSSSCTSQSMYAYCSAQKQLKDENKNTFTTSCAVFANEPSFSIYGIEKCSTIDCSVPCDKIEINGKFGQKVQSGATAKYDVSFMANDLSSGQLCVIE